MFTTPSKVEEERERSNGWTFSFHIHSAPSTHNALSPRLPQKRVRASEREGKRNAVTCPALKTTEADLTRMISNINNHTCYACDIQTDEMEV